MRDRETMETRENLTFQKRTLQKIITTKNDERERERETAE
jgi:hypothetical protein